MPDINTFDFWEGCNVHPLWDISDFTNLSREDFLTQCDQTVEDYVTEAVKLGYDEALARKTIIRQICEKYFFYFEIRILKREFMNHNFGYRLAMCVQYHKWNKLWVIAREHYKSTQITCDSTLWELCKDPNRTYCIYSYTVDMAKEKFLAPIKNTIETNELLRYIWDDVFWEEPARGYEKGTNGKRIPYKWTDKQIELKRTIACKEKTIEVGGIHGSSKTGGHYSHQIFDDCETLDNVTTGYSIETLYQEILMAFNTGQTNNMNFCFVGTFYAKEDAYTRMIKDHIVEEAIVQSCYDENGVSIHYPQEVLDFKRGRMGSLSVWATQMLCDPSMASQNTFNQEWLQFWEPSSMENFNNLNIYTVVDPASEKSSKKHDFTAICTVGIGPGETIMVLDYYKDHLTFEGKFKKLVEQYVKYHPEFVYYEEVGMQSDIASLSREMERCNTFFPIQKFSPIGWGDKPTRIEKVQFEFQSRRVWLPKYCFHTTSTGEVIDMTSFFISSEYSGYPHIIHDDMLDCLSHIVHLLREGKLSAPEFRYDSLDSRRRFRKEIAEDATWEPMEYARRA